MHKLTKIAITGPESTGKSMLAKQLANHYHALWVPEFARYYLQELGRDYVFDDVLHIARQQQKSQQAFEELSSDLLFSDTELLVTKIWCEVKYGSCHQWIEENLQKQDFDLYLLTDIDLPWEYDELREHPHQREMLFKLYQKALDKQGFPYVIISGTGEKRLRNAVEAVDKMMSQRVVSSPKRDNNPGR
ncbi:MAG TPA: ATP-binding protein [Bacteroidales bacterium]|nr:ATP-binding protein [Bacteroidales bacterium]